MKRCLRYLFLTLFMTNSLIGLSSDQPIKRKRGRPATPKKVKVSKSLSPQEWREALNPAPIKVKSLEAATLLRTKFVNPRGAYENPLIPPKTSSKKVTLVLDLDETLVTAKGADSPSSVAAALTFPPEFKIRIRPGAKRFLRELSNDFEIVCWTAGGYNYAKAIIDHLDPKKKYVSHWISRDTCTFVPFYTSEGQFFSLYFKDLSKLGRDLAKLLILDNSPSMFALQPSNGAYIKSWFGEKDDEELSKMMKFLKSLKDVEDVRPILDEVFRAKDLFESYVFPSP